MMDAERTGSMHGQVALVVGVGPGIGRACGLAFARSGADVAVAARRIGPLSDVAGEVAELTGKRVEPFEVDLADVSSCIAAVDAVVERFGRIDSLVTVATAGGGMTPVDRADWEVWRHAFEVNVVGTFEISRAAARAMAVVGGGAIVHVGTFGTHSLPPRQAAYTSTKQAMEAASRTLAKELGPSNIRVNIVTPGYTTGEPLDQLFRAAAERSGETIEQASARFASTAALRRHVDPADIAEAAVFLCSDRARNITGVEIPVTAGQHPL